ncbi:MAG: 1-phosphofructokinase [Oscillospiraceae bacterium]|nr:1-phosphofructokinase [Oscillospiraceae bacterium]
MVYTITLNPSLDYVMYTDAVEIGSVNAIERAAISAGGNGINISVMLGEFGVPSTALGFVAGFTGDEIERRVRECGINTDFVHLPHGSSRINVRLKTSAETELNAPGEEVKSEDIMELFVKLHNVADGDVLVLSGSVPPGCPSDIYAQILEYVSAHEIKTVVDTHGELLTETLKYAPNLIKMNLDGLAELFGDTPTTDSEVAAYAEQLQNMGAKNVLVSMGKDGALLMTEGGRSYRQGVCPGMLVNPVGAGDSMLAGVVASLIDNDVDFEYALIQGTAAGCATAFSEGLGKRDKIIELMKALMI